MIGLHRDARHFYSWNGDPAVPGITSIIGVLDKPALPYWYAEQAGRAVRDLSPLVAVHSNHLEMQGDCAICVAGWRNDTTPEARFVRWVRGAPNRARDNKANAGTAVHAIAEAIAKGEAPAIPAGYEGFAESFIRGFVEKYKPQFHPLYVEYMVYHEGDETVLPYGGTGDLICRIDDDVVLLDNKTNASGVYPETALQLAAARYAGFIGRPGDPKRYPIPKVDRCAVLWLRPEGAELIPYSVTPREFQAFTACRMAWDWVNNRAKEVKGAA